MKMVLPIAGFALMLLSALFFVAGSPATSVMPRETANFAGSAAGMLGVLVWVISGVTKMSIGSEAIIIRGMPAGMQRA